MRSGRDFRLLHHIDALTGVRGIAVLLVFLGHLQQRFFPYEALGGSFLLGAAYYGMTVFFVLSGFVIHWNYARLFADEPWLPAARQFFVARFARLWPLHFAITLLAAVLYFDLSTVLQHVFLVQTWVFQGTSNISFYNTWSISTEWMFYFVYALAYPLLARVIASGSVLLLAGMVAAGFAAYWTAGPVADPQWDMWVVYYSPYMRVLEFLTGVIAAQMVRMRRAARQPLALDLCFIGAIVATCVLYRTALGQLTNMNYLVAPLVAVGLIVASDARTLLSAVLKARWLLWVGDRSYSIYLLEAVYLVALGYDYKTNRVFTWGDFLPGLGGAALCFAVVLVASHFSWRYFEMPARSVIKRALSGGEARRGQG